MVPTLARLARRYVLLCVRNVRDDVWRLRVYAVREVTWMGGDEGMERPLYDILERMVECCSRGSVRWRSCTPMTS